MSKAKLRKIQEELDALDIRRRELESERTALRTGGDFVSKQDRARIDALDIWQATILLTFEGCCKHDGIDPKTRMAVFSPGNPVVPFYEKAIAEFKEFLSGNLGYVGLSMAGGRAK